MFLHDPDYFHLTMNPDSVPHLLAEVKQSRENLIVLDCLQVEKSSVLWFTQTRWARLSKEDDTCESDPSYSLNNCVKVRKYMEQF